MTQDEELKLLTDTKTWPGFWRNEVSGVLRPVVEAYIDCKALDARGIATMRAYLRQWINAPAWDMGEPTEELRRLRARVELLQTQAEIAQWIWEAMEIGIDPL